MIHKLTLLFIVILLSACFRPQYDNYQHQIFVFGTLVDINIWHDNNAQVEQAINEIDNLFKNMHHQWHAWKPGRLHDINGALRAGKAIQLTREEAVFIRQVIKLSKQSNHHFNPTIGELINLWGFHTDDYPITSPPPMKETIKELAQQQLTVNTMSINNLTLSSTNRHIWLDFGGIAKGLAVDQAIAIIREQGIENAIVNAGGDLRSIGTKGDRAWRIGIQSPKSQSILAEIQITQDESVFTSGNYQRYKSFEDKRYAHIIDGRTGLPVQDIISATVITDDGVTADAAATALIVAGNEKWRQVARSLQLDKVLLINNQNQCLVTKAMHQRLKNISSPCQIFIL